MKPDPATPFADLLPAVETGNLVTLQVEVLPGPGHGPAGMATYEGVVVEVLKDIGTPDGLGRYFRSFRLRNGSREEEYRFDYRGTSDAEAWFRRAAGEDPFDDSDLWGRRRRVYSFEVEGKGITARRERPGHSFVSVPTTENE
jgi:hypothetical protein